MHRLAILGSVLAILCALAPRSWAMAPTPDSRLAKYRLSQQEVEAAENAARSPDHQMGRFLERYLWFVPQARGHKASLGVGLFLFVALLLMFAGRLSGLDSATFGRSVAMAGGLLSVVLLQHALIPPSLPFVLAVVLVDLIAWFAAVRGLYGADSIAGGIMLVLLSFLVLVFVLSLEVLGFCLGQAGML